MPSPTDLGGFLDVLVRSRLFDSDRGEVAVRELAPECRNDPVCIAAALVEQGLLSEWQADRLLAGRHRGFHIGPYVLVGLLGQGGMGTVYLAQHRAMRRQVAIKVLHPKRTQPGSSVLERFHREARAVGQLDHRNVVRAYDVNLEVQSSDEIHYLVMEYVDGESIAETLRRSGPFDLVTAIDIARQTAEGLAHAHDVGLVHRDVKPANIMLDRHGTVKLLDLGLALLAEERSEDSSLTRANDETLLGTVDFVSPEQARDSHLVDERSDLYSLGCTLYYMLAGRAPFNEGSVTKRLMAHQSDPLPPIRSARQDVPAAVVGILERMTAKDPADRYQTGRELARDLLDWLLLHGDEAWRSRYPGITGDGSTLSMTRDDVGTIVGRPSPFGSGTDVPLPARSRMPVETPVGGGTVVRRWPWIVGTVLAIVVGIVIARQMSKWSGGDDPAAPDVSPVAPSTGSSPEPVRSWAAVRQSIREVPDALLYLSFDRDADRFRNESLGSPLGDLLIEVVGEPRRGAGRRLGSKALYLGGPETEEHLVVAPDDAEAFNIRGDFSTLVWFKVDGEFDVPHQALVVKGDNGFRISSGWRANDLIFAINDHRGIKEPDLYGPVAVTAIAKEVDVTNGNWHMVVGVVDEDDRGADLSVYVDGELKGTARSEDSLAPNEHDLLIGANPSHLHVRAGRSQRHFKGAIDEVLILTRALDEAAVRKLYDDMREQ